MSDINRLVYAILEFLNQQVESGALNEDATESVEVSMQCLESAYGVSISDDVIQSQLSTGKSLLDIFTSATGLSANSNSSADKASGGCSIAAAAGLAVISEEDKAKAEQLKGEGNEFMKGEKYEDAVNCYSKAISIDNNNAVFYCNRAAAYHKLNKHQQAIDDGNRAITIDPKYSKAYGRLGLSYSCLNDHKNAKESFSKALELDPTNEGHRANLNIAEQKMQESSMGVPPTGFGGQPSFGGMDLGSVLNNPMLMNMASQMMANPQMQQMMQGLLGQGMAGGFGGPGGAPATTQPTTEPTPPTNQAADSSPAAQPDGISNLLRAGQQLAQQVQQQNPELVEQLKQQFQQMPGGDDQQPPPEGGAGGV
ncbi:small glutamine-rich tetratricopeptide repeat-containing protein alpha-like [Anneissia japonica]|uniref:small glutamine-rich tetratricopeptide repeat-containing protein alpha-like n=1 Tax=Anneissia japonica TaxID=1529436 RepID=UPI0014255BD9|nr:small glutamine-rich tetratricopeptide repeat-containing protein alpha-like [Anneissia japonica]XP_033117081.1 small glutamine-rich tetratricopeptide repeat-containing protein alpha-like [Anneissia japonica]